MLILFIRRKFSNSFTISTKLVITSEEILWEYKNNARIEALGYLLFILIVIVIVAEYVVYRELAQEKEIIIGLG